MGGINPPPPPDPTPSKTSKLVQSQSKMLFETVSYFYSAHALIEEAVMQEADNNIMFENSIVGDIFEKFRKFEVAITKHLEILTECSPLFLGQEDWQTYFENQKNIFNKLSKVASELLSPVSIDGIVMSAKGKNLQESLYFNNENSLFRQNSLSIVTLLNDALSLHSSFVKEKNINITMANVA